MKVASDRPRLVPLLTRADAAAGYHERPRWDLVDVARFHGLRGRVLDVGCAAGVLGSLLLEASLATEVVGIERQPEVAELAAARLTSVYTGDVSAPDLCDAAGHPFDAMIFADVLEHLIEPLRVLRRFVARLPADGLCIISLPNVRYYRVVDDLLRHNEWAYTPEGVCDETHLRFFTFNSGLRLCNDAGLRVIAQYAPLTGRGMRVANAIPPATSFIAAQFILVCRRSAESTG